MNCYIVNTINERLQIRKPHRLTISQRGGTDLIMRNVKKAMAILLAAAAVLGGMPLQSFALTPYPKLEGTAAILLDMTTGEVLYELNADERRYPASTTKMMTGLLAIENLDPESDITVDSERITVK